MAQHSRYWRIISLLSMILLSSCDNRSAPERTASTDIPLTPLSLSVSQATALPAYPLPPSEQPSAYPYPAAMPTAATASPINQTPTLPPIITETLRDLAQDPLRSGYQLCAASHPGALYTAASANRRYQSFTYQYDTLIFVTCVEDIQAHTFFTAGRGMAVEFAWSPSADYLVVNEEALQHRTYIINATTGMTVELPVQAVWGATVYDPNPMGVALDGTWSPSNSYSGMAWSPDGARLAIDTKDSVYLFQTNKLWQKGGETALERVIAVPLINRPAWSTDGEFLLGTKVIHNDDGQLHPTSMDRIRNVRINTHTGVIQELAN